MNNNVQVNLQFTANTTQAKQELANLQTQLTALINQPVPVGAKMTADIQKATAAAAELKVHLQNATNVKTGMLDFGKLNQSIKQSGMSLSQYGAQLQSLGPQGQQAFMQLANSVAAAEVPIRRASGALTGMMTTFKNTAKWMVSSTVLNGFIRTMSSAYGYAKDLNESLNNIRIVTGHNIDQMAKFAVEANKAARALSATTTEYTNASLIYYQQGLNDQQVKERTDVTIKMANVSRQSAEIVSDQMTAVWNNFYDGSKSLESYADALTALGAATASSTDEIAQGLEKFAAIANTVGLSYEYATAALATVTAQTRQSADVVGTAFKTLFARIQDLKLGETLEDGTTLGQYSEALNKVGINIKTTNGDLKDMDDILNEMGAKWKTLERDEQAALAKAVGGLRQYNQIIALMDNWDFMKKNLNVVENSTGTLQKQADIYAESWEAASKRVKASAEKVYSTLLNDKFFIELNNGLAEFLDGIGAVMKGMGGLKGVLSAIGVLVTRMFHEQIAQGFRNAAHNLKMMTAAGREAVQQAKYAEMDKMKKQLQLYSGRSGMDNTMTTAYGDQIEAQSKIISNAEHMSEIEKTIAQTILDQGKALANNAIEYAKQADLAKEKAAIASGEIYGMVPESKINKVNYDEAGTYMKNFKTKANELGKIKGELQALASGAEFTEQQIADIETRFKSIKGLPPAAKTSFEDFIATIRTGTASSEELKGKFGVLTGTLKDVASHVVNTYGSVDKLAAALGIEGPESTEKFKQKLVEYINEQINAGQATQRTATSLDNAKQAFNAAGDAAEKAKGKTKDWANNVTNVASTLMSVSMLLSSINGLIDTLQDPDTSGWEKFLAILSSVSMAAMSLVSVMTSVAALSFFAGKAKKKETQEINENSDANIVNAATEDKVQKEKGQTATASGAKTGAMQKDTTATTANSIANGTTGTYQGRKVVYNEKMGGWTWADSVKDKNGRVGRGRGKGGMATKNGALVTQTATTAPAATNAPATTTASAAGGWGSGAAAIGVAAVGVAVAAYSIYKVSEALDEHNQKAEEAKERVQELEKSYEDTRTQYDSFMNSTKSYKDLIVSMSSLTKGTLEYKEALLDANKEAMHLIETYEDLDYSINKDGLIQITNESFEKVQEQELQKLQKQQNAIFYGRTQAERAQADANSINFRRNYAEGESGLGGETDGSQFLGAFGTGAGAGLAIGTMFGPIGSVIGLVIGAIAGAISGLIWTATDNDATQAEVEALNSLEKAYIKNGDQALSAAAILQNVEIDDAALRQSLAVNAEATAEQIKAQIASKDAIEANTRAILGETVGTEGAALLTKSAEEKAQEIRKEINDQREIEEIHTWSDLDSNSSVAYLTKRYDEATGKNLNWLADNVVQWKDGRNQMVYTVTEDGQTVDKYLDIETMYNEIIAAELAKRVAEDEENKEILTAQEKIEDKYGENFYTNVVDAILTKETTAESLLGENLTHQNLETLLNIGSRDELRKLLEESSGMSLEDFLSKSKYAEDVNTFLDSQMQAIQTAGAVLTDTLNSLAPELKEGFNNLISTGRLGRVSEKGKTDLVSAFNTLLVEESPEIANQFMDMLNGMAPEAVAAFTQTLSEKGLRSSAQDFNSSFSALAEDMGVGEEAIASFISIWEQFSKVINSTAKDIEDRIITLKKLQSGETKTLADAIKDYLGLDIDEASLNNPKQREVYRQQLKDKGYTETEDGLWVYNEESGKAERDKLVSDSATRANNSVKNMQRFQKIDTSSDAFDTSKETYYYGSIETSALNILPQTLTNLAKKLNSNYESEDTQFQVNGNTVKVATEGESQVIDLSILADMNEEQREQWLEQADLPTYLELELEGISYEQWDQIKAVLGKERRDDPRNVEGIIGRYQDSFAIDTTTISDQANAIKTVIETMGGMQPVEEIIGPNAFEHAGIPDYNALNKLISDPNGFITNEEVAKRFSGLWEKIRTAIENGSFEKRLEEQRESTSGELIQNLYKNAQYSDLATLASSGQYQGQQFDLTDAQKEQAYWYGTKATTNIAELEGGGKYTDYLVEAARVSDQFDDKLIETREAAEQLAASVLKVQVAFSELQDTDYNQLFDTLYSGTYDWASPQYQQAEKEFDTLIRKLLNLEYENINTIMLFSQEVNRDLLDGLMSGAIEYEEFTQGVAKNYALNMAGVTDETYTTFLESSFAELGELAHGEEASKALIGTLNKIGIEAVDLDNILEILGYNVERSLDGQITRVTKLGNELINFDEILQNTQKDIDKLKDTDFFERYKEVNDALDNVANALERVNKQADRMYGKSRLQYMEAANKLLGNEIELLEYKRQEAQAYLIQDQENLNQIAKENIGATFDFNTTGDITNYDEIMSSVRKNYDSYYNKAKKGGFSEDEQNRLEDYSKAASAVQEAISTYDETKELLEDIENEIRETVYSIQDNNYKKFTYEIEIDAEIRSIKLDWNQYNLDKVMTDLLDAKASGNFDKLTNERFTDIENALTKTSKNITKLEKLHEQGMAVNELVVQDQIELNNLTAEEMGISRADFIEGLQEERQNLYDNISTLQELDMTMQSYYGDTLAAVNEEIEKHISLMTNASGVLEHYQNLMKLTGKGTDYKAIGRVLEGQANIAIQTLAASTAIYEERSKEAELALQNYQDALVNGAGEKSIETLKNIWMTAQSEANDAQNKMLEDTQKWAEAQNAILENSLADLGKTLEQAITGGSSYEDLTTALDRAAASQEEYLTTTNKIYETNKLINKAQQEIDKTTNTVAKRRLQNFAKETEQLQQQARLSNFELEIQQAKYNLLLAEIALEEAQNAKSVVRLQRNAEGSFGYVYTADQNAVDDAQQQVEDAENDLYNIRLRGANDYTQKSIELQTRFNDEMMELNKRRQEGEFENEQAYNEAVLALEQHYYEQLKTYANLYGVAISEDARVFADAWSSSFKNMTTDTEGWLNNTKSYITGVQEAFSAWEENLKPLYEKDGALFNIDNSMKNIVDSTKTLRDLLMGSEDTNGIIKDSSEAVRNALNLVAEYGKVRDIYVGDNGLLNKYEEELKKVDDLIIKWSNFEDIGLDINHTVVQEVTVELNTNKFDIAVKKFENSNNNLQEFLANLTTSRSIEKGTMIKRVGMAENDDSVGIIESYDDFHQLYSIIFRSGKKALMSRQEFELWQGTSGGSKGTVLGYLNQIPMPMDTGGYTGEWGPEGKIAMLHEKELVLNSDDTSNFLSALGLLDNILLTLDKYSASAQLGGLLNTPGFLMNNSEALEQNVHIEASFPGVTDRNEIEEAFNNLVNRASQYANRK